ncbi:MAG TPA: DUF2975 domain-containing protein [Bacteroidia bacterium]|nr:DUF2975 domain-containing protein [Bacteroidia bacterium]
MKTKTEKILSVLHVLAWVAMIGYAVNFGSQLISFVVSFANPAASKKIPGVAQNLLFLQQDNFWFYVCVMSFVMALSAMFVQLWYIVITLLSKLNIKSPFTIEVSKKLEKIAYLLFTIWVVGFIGEHYVDWLSKRLGEQLNIIKVANEFLFISGIVYIISQIFRRGIEIQEENQQTI